MPPQFGVGWFYIVDEEAGKIMKKLFDAGLRPGAVIAVSAEEFETISEGVLCYPIHVVGERKIVVAPGMPQAL